MSDGAPKAGGKRTAAKKPSREASVAVVGKAIALLDVLAGVREATTADLAERLGEPRSSVYRLLNTLSEGNIVEPGAHRGTYRLGLKLLQLGSAVVARLDVRLAALPVMERIHDETEETVFLCLRRDREAVCIERIDGRRAAVMALKLGGALPLHAGAGPRALLAVDRRREWDIYIGGGPIEDLITGEPIRREDVIAQLEETRRRGAGISDEDLTPGFAAIGAPIYDHRGHVIAALSVSGVRNRILDDDEEKVLSLLLNGAREISRALGFDGVRDAEAA
ncbi:MAG: IclR family transcriptional regulator [Actinobacteria bacterium]|nr:IclR family transcriptional regulator [Actinomycetota bacterium]